MRATVHSNLARGLQGGGYAGSWESHRTAILALIFAVALKRVVGMAPVLLHVRPTNRGRGRGPRACGCGRAAALAR